MLYGEKMIYEDNEGRKYTSKEVSELSNWQYQELGIKPVHYWLD